MKTRLAVAIALLGTMPASAQWLDLRTPGIPRAANGAPELSAPAPRTAEGRPDLSGLWVPISASGDLFDPSRIQDWALANIELQKRNFFGDDPRFHCLPSGPGSYTAGAAYGGMRRLVQSRDLLAVLNSDLSYRQIFLDGRELEADPFPTWTGYSVGQWDGDTLVVESNGYNDKTWLHREGLPHTEQLRITERYRRVDFGHIELELTYDDPGTFTAPVRASVTMRLVADSELLETVCNESTTGRSFWGGDIADAEQKELELAAEQLARYVGSYEGVWLGNRISIEVTLDDGDLYLDRDPPYSANGVTETAKSRLIAQSDNAFECDCGLGFVFNANEGEAAHEVLEVHVSGGWTFPRVD